MCLQRRLHVDAACDRCAESLERLMVTGNIEKNLEYKNNGRIKSSKNRSY